MADAQQRAAVSRWLELALTQLPRSVFVVTSRYAGYREEARLNGRFLELHSRDLTPEEATGFVSAWYLAVESQAELGRDPEVAEQIAAKGAAELAERIFRPVDPRTSRLRELATNPLLLQILCLVHRDRKNLPERRVELYEECVKVLLETWRKACGRHRSPTFFPGSPSRYATWAAGPRKGRRCCKRSATSRACWSTWDKAGTVFSI